MKKTYAFKAITLFIPFLILLIWLGKSLLIQVAYLFPPCAFHQFFDLYCPGCGNTRSVLSILDGHIIRSLRFNIVPFLFLVFAICSYIEMVTFSFGKHRKLLPRKASFYFTIMGILFAYFIVRNFSSYLTP
ncbi:MAG: hypothetical protein K0S47_3699 [Herbinix sp.]|jgi:hypothetical protein|nr:hypothetical protein [Herbinix sp.]